MVEADAKSGTFGLALGSGVLATGQALGVWIRVTASPREASERGGYGQRRRRFRRECGAAGRVSNEGRNPRRRAEPHRAALGPAVWSLLAVPSWICDRYDGKSSVLVAFIAMEPG